MAPILTNEASDAAHALRVYLQWACAQEWADISPPARQRAVRVLGDDVSAALSALHQPEVALAHSRLTDRADGRGQASLLAAGLPALSLQEAALGNGLAMGWNELDEGYRHAVCHAGLYILPALLAVAQVEKATMADTLRALVLGYETVTRIARTWKHAAMVIHPHALLAPVGAAAGVGFLRRLSPEVMEQAIATAATMGMVGPYNQALQGVLSRNTWAPQGAVSGLQALEWAVCGFGGEGSSLHAVYVAALGWKQELSFLSIDATKPWAIESGYLKRNACCQYAHSTIEAVQSILVSQPQLLGGQQVTAIEVEVHSLGFALDNCTPSTTLGAKFSTPHAVAAALVHGHGEASAFDATSLTDVRVARLRQLVTLRPFEGVREWPHDRPARVSLTTTEGERFTAECWSAQGGPDRPFDDETLWHKIGALSQSAAPGWLEVVRQLDALAVQSASGLNGEFKQSWSTWLHRGFAVVA
ncbi:MmgE/PrpD family protein [Ottowia thiooxydans]|uniref:MmgE/PrpD family protein n=1 Tax=Ottowia thiooxydans TaxID=219182 RepID=UPI00041B489C|nr:MmgE/PrpD family protein [Ottowia thiooxydans]